MAIFLASTQNRKKSSSAALEFQEFQGISMVFRDIWVFPGLSRPGILNNRIPGLSRVCTNPGKGNETRRRVRRRGRVRKK